MLTRDQNSTRLYRTCYRGGLKCGTRALTRGWARTLWYTWDHYILSAHSNFSDKRTECPKIFEMVRHIKNLIGLYEVVVVNLHVQKPCY